VVRQGESIGGARVEEIGKDAVVIAHASRRERLSFGAPGASSSAGPTTTAAELARAHGDAGRDDEPRARAARRTPTFRARPMARRPTAKSASFAKPRTNDEVIADISRQARFQPLLDDAGKLRGVAVLGIVPDSMLERFGLQSGDVVTHVAGVKIDNTANAYNTLRGLNLANGVEVTVVRRGAPTTVNVPPGAF
jgi:type II secretory pathway component PulC